MAYFAPYIDGTGLHMPTYEDRLADLWEKYCVIFDVDPSLSASAPDYQLLAAFARMLDEVSALIAQVFGSRNPGLHTGYITTFKIAPRDENEAMASGQALDLLLSQYGLTRRYMPYNTDEESARSGMYTVLASRGACLPDSLEAGVRGSWYSSDPAYSITVNETDEVNADGVPPRSVAVAAYWSNTEDLAQAIFDHLPPGIGTYGSDTATAYDSEGKPHTVNFTSATEQIFATMFYVTKLDGADEEKIKAAIVPAVMEYLYAVPIGGKVNLTQLIGVAYASDPSIANTYLITDVAGTFGDEDPWHFNTVMQAPWNRFLFPGVEQGPLVFFLFN